jgi:hypothetical protein
MHKSRSLRLRLLPFDFDLTALRLTDTVQEPIYCTEIAQAKKPVVATDA